MIETTTGQVTSADGTSIVYDRRGEGPALILVHGAFTDRTHPTLYGVATALAPWFTTYNYDRRGRGGSGDTPPYAPEREVEDLLALVATAGGTAMVFGGSSGAALALRAARDPAITRLALWEPPYHVDPSAPALPRDFAARLETLVARNRRAEAVERFMIDAAEVPPDVVTEMRADPSWPEMERLAHTLAYEAAVLGPGNALPVDLLTRITTPALVLTGEASRPWMISAGKAVATTLPNAVYRTLENQTHNVSPKALAPELLEFFIIA